MFKRVRFDKRRKMNIKSLLSICLLGMFINSFTQEKHLDLVITLDDGGKGSWVLAVLKAGQKDAIIHCITDTILQEVPLLLSSSLLYVIKTGITQPLNWQELQKTVYKEGTPEQVEAYRKTEWEPYVEKMKNAFNLLANSSKWRVYHNKMFDYILLLPNSYYKDESLKNLGFNVSEWNKISSEKSLLTFGYKSDTPFNSAHFSALFDPNSSVRKRIYLEGHGKFERPDPQNPSKLLPPLIASLDPKQYMSFLKFLNPTTDFLFVFSCYAGGANLQAMYKDYIASNKKLFSKEQINFPIAMGATTDIAIGFDQTPDFRTFFRLLNIYLNNPSKGSLKDALQEIYKNTPGFEVIPSVRFPGFQDFFRAQEVDKVIKIITMVGIRTYELEYKLKSVPVPALSIKDIKALLVYPALITVPFDISSKKPITVVSMIPGNSYHLLQEVKAKNMGWIRFIQSFMDLSTKSTKAFFIKKATIEGYPHGLVNEDILIYHEGELITVIYKSSIDNNYYKEVYKLPNFFTTPEQLTREEALKTIRMLLEKSKPNEEALFQATAGMQTLSMLQEVINSWLQ